MLVDATAEDRRAYGAQDDASDADAGVWKAGYGSFIPQLGAPPRVRAKHLLRCQGAAFGGFDRANQHRFVELGAIHLFDMRTSPSGRRVYFPCFALVRTALEIPPRKSRGALFIHPCKVSGERAPGELAYSDPLGIIGLKEEAVGARETLTHEAGRAAWLGFACAERARRIAWEIR